MSQTHEEPTMPTPPATSITRHDFDCDLDVVDDAIKLLIRHCTITESPDDNAISRSTIALNLLSNGCNKLLLTRAKYLANKGKLEEAISDTLKAIEHQPTTAEGYLAAGELYSTQGTQQAAINIYEQGLRTVLPSEWPLLYERREAAKEQMNRRIDFVVTLPGEITAKIFIQLIENEVLLECVEVSRYWRECLLNKGMGPWRSVCIDWRPNFTDPARYLLPSISNHIQNLILELSSNHIMTKLMSIAKNNEFSSVTSLELEMEYTSVEQNTQFIALFKNRLSNLRLTIWRDIRVPHRNATMIEINAIVSVCPNLKYFCLLSEYNISYQPQQSPPPLLGLVIIAPNIQEQLENLVSHFPRLQQLVTNQIVLGAFEFVQRYCPEIRHLEILGAVGVRPAVLAVLRRDLRLKDNRLSLTYLSNWSSQQDEFGLRTSIYNTSTVAEVDLIHALKRNITTWRTLQLNSVTGWDVVEVREQLAHIGFDNLSELQLNIRREHVQIVASLIHQCPKLERVELRFGLTRVPESFFTCLMQKPLLRTVQLYHLDSLSATTSQFLAHHAARHQECALRSIAFIGCRSITYEEINTLADVTTIREIDLSGSLHCVSPNNLMAFTQKLHTLPYLKAVSLRSAPHITYDMFIELAEIDGLEEIQCNLNGAIPDYTQNVLESRGWSSKNGTVWKR